MAQTDIDLGTGQGNNDGDFVYTFAQVSQSNFDDLYALIATAGNLRISDRAIGLEGQTGSEFQRVASAINAQQGVTVLDGFLPVFSYYRVYAQSDIATYFVKDSYLLKTGSGFYGSGTVPPGVTAITVNKVHIFKFASETVETGTADSLGEIGTTPINTAVNSSGTLITVDGDTVFNITRSGVPEQYVFSGEDGDYGAAGLSTNAGNFILLKEDDFRNKGVSEASIASSVKNTDIIITEGLLSRTNRLTQDNAIVTIQDDLTLNLPSGSTAKASFGGIGTHTINYPITDGLSTQTFIQGDLVYLEKVANDTWIVKKY
jgi:hypothetical protein